MRKLSNLSVILCLLMSSVAWGWGDTGHQAVGAVAEMYLTTKTSKKVKEILNGESLSFSAIWADEVKSNPNYRFLSTWHYISVPDDKHAHEVEPGENSNVVDAINRMKLILKGEAEDERLSEAEALKLLAHFVGDIHQPLHVGRAVDYGGNAIKILWFDEPVNIHQVWDSGMINHSRLSFTELSIKVSERPVDESWLSLSVEDWAEESFELRRQVYDFREMYIEELAELPSNEELMSRNYENEKLQAAIAELAKYSLDEQAREAAELLLQSLQLVDDTQIRLALSKLAETNREGFYLSRDISKLLGVNSAVVGQIGYNYSYRNWPVVQLRIHQAGVRLAETLNEIYGGDRIQAPNPR